jgi:DNA-binding transcriptional ArsR family regulator
MSDRSATLQSALRSLLAQRGVASAAQLVAALDISQPTLSRALAALAGEVAVLGAGFTRTGASSGWALCSSSPALGCMLPRPASTC